MLGKKRTGFLLFLIIFILLGLVVYSYKDKFSVLYKTGISLGKDFINKNFTKKNNKKKFFEKIDLSEKKKSIQKKTEKIKENINDIKETITEDKENKKIEKQKKEKIVKEKAESIKKEKSSDSNETIHNRISIIYFSRITDDEKLNIISVKREISFTDMPLTETIKELLKGPNEKEKKHELITNIPQKTKLLSLYIKSNIAYLNLSEEFEYNSYGRDSTVTQIKQIVYTITEFSNIKAVQFLINGKVKTYLGGEGIIINKPLSRNDFS